MSRILRLLLALSLAASLAACSSEKRVGTAIDVEELTERSERLGGLSGEEEENQGGGFVGEQEQRQRQQQQQAQERAQAEQQEAVARQREAAAVGVSITASGYDPYFIRVFAGGVVTFTNTDSRARTVTADRGEFSSGPIAPGETWTYEPQAAGRYNFHDDTRPFVVGTLEVLDR